MSYATYFTPHPAKVKSLFCGEKAGGRRPPAFTAMVNAAYPRTASNSAQISSSGFAVQRLTATITRAEITKAGSSS